MARVFAVASAKGGVGKTTTTANVGAMLAGTGADVVVIDGDIGMANLGAALGIDTPANTLHDVLSGTATPTAATYEGPGGVYVVPGETALSAYAEADPSKLQSVINVHSQADYVLIDVGAGVSHESSLPLSIADEVLLVSTPERDAVQDTEKTRQLTNQLGGTVTGAVITRVEESTPVAETVSGTLGTEILATIPEDAAVPDALAVGEPLADYAPRSPAAEGYRDLVAALTDREPERPPEPTSTADAETTTTDSGDTTTDETAGTGAIAEEETTTTSESETSEAEPATADTAGDTGANTASDATTRQRPRDDSESKWAKAATGDHVDDESDESEQTAESIAEATEADSDSATAPASADDIEPTPESDADSTSVAATTVDKSTESGEGETESAPATNATPEEGAGSDIASEAEDSAGGEHNDTPASDDGTTTGDGDDTATSDDATTTSEGDAAGTSVGDDATTGNSTESRQSGSGGTPEPADATTTDDSDDVEDGVSIPESEGNSEETPDASGEATPLDADDGSESGDDAVPFRDEDDASDEVVDPVEPQPSDPAEDEARTDDSPTEEEPVIPDAEGDDSGSAVPTELMGGPDEEEPDDEDKDDESKGFLRRLFFG
jgi:ATPases involved in chromosome partitioning